MTDAPPITDTYWTDSEGRQVPLSLVKPADQMKDEVVRRLIADAVSVQNVLAVFKETAMAEVLAAKDLIFEQYGVKTGGVKGNLSLKSFDGKLEVQFAVNQRLSFGPELQAAKALIDECIEDWATGGNANIRALVEYAFQVNKAGRIDTGRVLGLRKLDMKDASGAPDPKWARAMGAITDAVRTDGSASYIRFYQDNGSGRLDPISLNIAAL